MWRHRRHRRRRGRHSGYNRNRLRDRWKARNQSERGQSHRTESTTHTPTQKRNRNENKTRSQQPKTTPAKSMRIMTSSESPAIGRFWRPDRNQMGTRPQRRNSGEQNQTKQMKIVTHPLHNERPVVALLVGRRRQRSIGSAGRYRRRTYRL